MTPAALHAVDLLYLRHPTRHLSVIGNADGGADVAETSDGPTDPTFVAVIYPSGVAVERERQGDDGWVRRAYDPAGHPSGGPLVVEWPGGKGVAEPTEDANRRETSLPD